MSTFVVRPIRPEVTNAVRTTARSPQYGHPVHQERARGTGPCRECLSGFRVGEEDRSLFTYNPFDGSTLIAQPGPVFIHTSACVPFAGAGYPEGLRELPVVAEAHLSDGSRSAIRELPRDDEAGVLADMLAPPNVAFIHLRHAEAGCFIARVDRQ